MTKPDLRRTIAQVIADNELPESLKHFSMEDLIKIVNLCQEHRFKKGDRSVFTKKFETELDNILKR